jgi:Lrp/AsnC family transcriptional regulator, regulator for asnA, asnC and gidA
LKIDELDLRLLNILQRDSSMPLVKIAGSLHVTEGTVRNRIARLRRTGVIKKFTVSVDSAATGQAVVAFVLLNAAPGRLADVAKKLSALDSISEVYETHTYGDLLLKVRAKSTSDLADIMASKIKAVGGVVGTQVITVLNAWKE